MKTKIRAAVTLYLNLKRKWFDMHLSGVKKVEYRALTFFWANRLFEIPENEKRMLKKMFLEDPTWGAAFCMNNFDVKNFDSVLFSNDMKPIEESVRFTKDFKGLTIEEGVKEWGAEKGVFYFCLEVGNVKLKQNC